MFETKCRIHRIQRHRTYLSNVDKMCLLVLNLLIFFSSELNKSTYCKKKIRVQKPTKVSHSIT